MPHNGGLSQLNFNFLGNTGSWPFLNLQKNPTAQWTFVDNQGYPAPDTLDANGYPTSISHGGVYKSVPTPTQAQRPGRIAVTWDSVGTTTVIVQGFPLSGATGSKTTSAATGRYEFLPTDATTSIFQIGIATVGVSNMKVFHIDDETLINQGKIYGQKFLEVLRQGNCGVVRFLNWQLANTSNVTTANTRKPFDYVYWSADEWRSSLYATPASSPMTNVGNDYSITFGSGGPTDKQTLHINFNAAPTLIAATVTYTSGNPGTVNAVGHPFVNGDPVGLRETASEPTLIWHGENYYVVNAAANTFQLARAPGGPAIAIGTGGSGTHTVIRLCTINLNGTGAVPIRNLDGDSIGSPVSISPTNSGGFTCYGTIVYDADFPAWLLYGAADGTLLPAVGGISNGMPIEAMFQLAVELGAHPWFCSPRFVLDPMTDWTTWLVNYCKANRPSWMIPRFESVNEITFNSAAGFSTRYAWNKSFLHWAVQFDAKNWQGKISSTLGQAVNAAWGGAVDGVECWAIAGIQTVAFSVAGGGSSAVLGSTLYLSQAAPAQSGYVKEAASNWLTHVCGANYFSPSIYNTATETTLAAAYAGGDLSAATTYADYCNAAAAAGFDLAQLRIYWSNLYAWAQSFTNRDGFEIRMTAYEGGYSPDVNVGESSNVRNLRLASKHVADMYQLIIGGTLADSTVCAGNYNDFVNAGGEFPSCFQFEGGSSNAVFDNIWSIFDTNIYATPSPQWAAIVDFNNSEPPPPTPADQQPPASPPYLNAITTTTLRHRSFPVPSGYPHAKSSLVSPYGHRANQRLGSTFRSGSPNAHRIGAGIKLPPRRRK